MLRFTQRTFARALSGAAVALFLTASASGVACADPAATTTTLSSSPNPSQDGQTVRFEALISGGPDGAPDGTVDFTEGGNPIAGGSGVAINRLGAGHTIAMGNHHACVITIAGAVSCVGSGNRLQNGDAGQQDTNVFGDMGLSSVVALALGGDHSCALNSAGVVSCWGKNFNAELGNQSGNDSATPLSISLNTAAKAIAAGQDFNCALLVGGTVECWGGTLHGQQGDGSVGGGSGGEAPHAVPGLSNVKAITAGFMHACALLDDGTVKCWGLNDVGQLGNNNPGFDEATPVAVSNLSNVIALGGGGSHTCALRSDGTVACWGYNGQGGLGDGTNSHSGIPVDVSDPGKVYVGLASGANANHTCGITSTGTVRCWGSNFDGELGNSTQTEEHTPVSTGFHSANNISLGSLATCVTLVGGGAECVGANGNGQFGLGYFGNGSDINDPGHRSYILMPTPTIAAGSLLTFSRATMTTSSLTVASHNIVATYNGDLPFAYLSSSSDPLPQIVSAVQQASGIAVDADINPSTFGQSVTFTATVTGAGATPTGTVTFQIDGVSQSPVNLDGGGIATLTTSALSVGGHSVISVYNGDPGYFGHTSSTLTQTVNKTPAFTSADSTTFLIQVANTFTVTTSAFPTPALTIAGGSLPPGISFNDNTDGTATFSGTGTAAGDYNLTLQASNGIGAPVSQAFTFHVTKNSSTVTLDATTTKLVGQAVTFTAHVSAGSIGTVTFFDGATSLAVKSLSGNTAVHQTSSLAAGSHTITAVYNGDDTHFGSTSASRTQVVGKGATTMTVTANPASPAAGSPFTLTAHVTVNSPASATVTGNVTFKNGATTLGTAAVSGGSAHVITSLTIGNYTITASYTGNASLNASSGSKSVNVGKATTQFSLTASPAIAKPGQSVKFTAHITSAGGTPTGTVTFKNGTASLGSATLSGGNAVLATSALKLGVHTITATYAATATFAASSASKTVTISAAVGAEQKVNSHAGGNQQYPAIARLLSGYVVVWESNGQDGSGFGVYGQRYDKNFVKAGAEFKINTTTAKQQFSSRVAALIDGGFVVTYQSQSAASTDYNIYVQRFKANGTRSGGELHVNPATAGLQSAPSVAGLPDGGFVVAWESPDGNGIGVFARAYTKTSAPKAVARVNTTTAGEQAFVDVTGLLKGGYVVTWHSAGVDGSGRGIVAQRYTAANAKAGGQVVINTFKTHDQLYPSIAATSDGGYVVTWVSDGQDGSHFGVYMQRYNKAGAKVGAEQRVNTTTASDQWEPTVAGFATGGFIVMWTSPQDGSGYGIYGQIYKATGAKVQGEFKVNTFTTGNQWHPAVAGFNAGTAIGVWTSDSQDGGSAGIYSQRIQMPGVSPPPKK